MRHLTTRSQNLERGGAAAGSSSGGGGIRSNNSSAEKVGPGRPAAGSAAPRPAAAASTTFGRGTRGYILTTDQSDAGRAGIFSRRSTQIETISSSEASNRCEHQSARDVRIYSHDEPIGRGTRGSIRTTDPSDAGHSKQAGISYYRGRGGRGTHQRALRDSASERGQLEGLHERVEHVLARPGGGRGDRPPPAAKAYRRQRAAPPAGPPPPQTAPPSARSPAPARLVCRENIPARPASDWSVVRIYPRVPRPIGARGGRWPQSARSGIAKDRAPQQGGRQQGGRKQGGRLVKCRRPRASGPD
eukprot:1195131-Prorocentrum_minimum.AAC.5